jgi:hypothetical protein
MALTKFVFYYYSLAAQMLIQTKSDATRKGTLYVIHDHLQVVTRSRSPLAVTHLAED